MMPLEERLFILLFVLLQWVEGLREARPMSRDFFTQILFTTVGTDFDYETNDSPLDDWDIQTEWNWNYAAQLEESKEFPFVFCNDDFGLPTLQRREAIGEAINKSAENEMVTLYNTPNVTCVTALAAASIAQDLGQFIVQPIGFIMKLNSGSVDFVADETHATEYAVNICPGLPWLNLTRFSLDTIDDIVTEIGFLLTVPEIEPFTPDLLMLQGELEQDDDYCNVLVDSVSVEQADIDYVILRLEQNGFAPDACFLLLALGLAHAPEICFIERREPFVIENAEAQWITQSGKPNERPFFDVAIRGKGQVVAVSDSGLDLKNCYFRDALAEDFIFGDHVNLESRKVIQYVDYVDTEDYVNGHGTHVCGTVAGKKSEDGIVESDGFVDGVAEDAKLAFFDIGNRNILRVPGASRIMGPGVKAGALTHSASWGSRSRFYTNQDRDFDRWIYNNRNVAVVVAAGNRGPKNGTIYSPANAKNVIAVGASTSAGLDIKPNTKPVEDLYFLSSRGPSMDQRIKPDVLAPGSFLLSAGARSEESCDPPSIAGLPGPGAGRNSPYGIASKEGTSMATPVVSGSVAMIRQYFEEGWYGDGTKGSAPGRILTGAMVKSILVNGAKPILGNSFNHVDSVQGFGLIRLIDSLPLKDKNEFVADFQDNQTVDSGGLHVYEYVVDTKNLTCNEVWLSTTISWTDPPGFTSCLRCLLNDLDLHVEKTSGSNPSSVHFPNGLDGKDSLNNVERVRVQVADGDFLRVVVTTNQLESVNQTYAIATSYGCFTTEDSTASSAMTLVVPPLVVLAATGVALVMNMAIL